MLLVTVLTCEVRQLLKPDIPLAIYMEGSLGADIGKMGYGVLRYSPNPVVAVIDSVHAGKTVQQVVQSPRDCPVVATIADALHLGAKALILGIAPPGGRIPAEWMNAIQVAVDGGMSILNGLHEPLTPKFPGLSKGQFVWDIRQEPTDLAPGTGAARTLNCRRILMVGTDMAVGKMTAGLELLKAARETGINAEFVATGQIGITVTGAGVPLDAVRVDYASGSIEREMMRYEKADWIIVEGQGSLVHPGSTATLPLLRGSMPTDMILCVQIGQTHLRRIKDIPIPPLPSLMRLYEDLASVCGVNPNAQVRGIAANTSHLDDETARRELIDLESLTGVPATDPVRYGADKLVTAISQS
jgi:uncharacterized NAD-dependent epimerase/dehydratase family protein